MSTSKLRRLNQIRQTTLKQSVLDSDKFQVLNAILDNSILELSDYVLNTDSMTYKAHVYNITTIFQKYLRKLQTID